MAGVAALTLILALAGCESRPVTTNPATQRAETLIASFFAGHFRKAGELLSGTFRIPWATDYALFRYEARITHTPWDAIRWTIHCPPTQVARGHNWPGTHVASCTITFNQPWIDPLQIRFYTPLIPHPAGTFSAADWDVWMYNNGGPVPGALVEPQGPGGSIPLAPP
jgi:hypothetical protein